jgi:enoyl-CoA hydratase
MIEDLLTFVDGQAGRIRLNRPKALHALTKDMCSAMIDALVEWRSDAAVQAILIDHAEGRGFCAGGDIRMLADSGATDGAEARMFFFVEYRLNHLLFSYAKSTAAFMDGITMGGGVGISQPCRYRVATENTRFAMPETAIGLFPDVGGGWYLSRLPAGWAVPGLTGARLDGAECHFLGLATHYLPSEPWLT